ncbi:MAG: hypothetical protein WBG32_22380 [Nodosilinea sp.]
MPTPEESAIAATATLDDERQRHEKLAAKLRELGVSLEDIA